jgi:Fic family protein
MIAQFCSILYNSSMLAFRIDNRLIKKLIALNERVADQYAAIRDLSTEELDAIHRYVRVSMIGASTRIENAILTDAEVNWLDTILEKDAKLTAFDAHWAAIEDKLSQDRERSIEEVAGCRAVLSIVYEQSEDLFPLTEHTLCGFHAELMRYYPPAVRYAGRYKTHPNTVVETNHRTGKARTVLQTADPGPITAAAMRDLIDWYSSAIRDEPWSVAVACEFVFRFLAIHPFQDGNGRMGRALFLLALLQSRGTHLSKLARYLAIDRQIERHKDEYYTVLNRCSGGKYLADPSRYKIEFFLHYMIKVLEESLTDIGVYRRRFQAIQVLSPAARAVYRCFSELPERRVSAHEICKETHLPRRTTVHSLAVLTRLELLQKFGKGRGVRYRLVF